MKFCNLKVQVLVPVAPFTGAWIEITPFWVIRTPQPVAPFTGAWIEMVDQTAPLAGNRVAPFTGAWIEMPASAPREWRAAGRSLHGSVD